MKVSSVVSVLSTAVFVSATDSASAGTPTVTSVISHETCLPGGSTDSQGRYSCNPAHQYPEDRQCKIIDGCPFLVDGKGNIVNNGPASTVTHKTETTPSPTPTCLPGGSIDGKGRYSCNPAHQYPDGKTCKVVDGCPYLCDAKGNVLTDNGSATTIVHPTQTTMTTSSAPNCPAPGSSDSQGRYSCNPAHQYPNGQTCVVIDGCYFLCGADKQPIKSTPTGNKPVVTDHPKTNGTDHGKPPVTAGASALQGAGVLAIAAFAALL